jgi:hypothetical protein
MEQIGNKIKYDKGDYAMFVIDGIIICLFLIATWLMIFG